jgi:hypothetical protein
VSIVCQKKLTFFNGEILLKNEIKIFKNENEVYFEGFNRQK